MVLDTKQASTMQIHEQKIIKQNFKELKLKVKIWRPHMVELAVFCADPRDLGFIPTSLQLSAGLSPKTSKKVAKICNTK